MVWKKFLKRIFGRSFGLLCVFSFLGLAAAPNVCLAVPPQPYAMTGTITVDGQILSSNFSNYTMTVTDASGTVYQYGAAGNYSNPARADTWDISATGYNNLSSGYYYSVPAYDATDQPHGFNLSAGSAVYIHLYNSTVTPQELIISSPASGQATLSALYQSGQGTDINIVATTPVPTAAFSGTGVTAPTAPAQGSNTYGIGTIALGNVPNGQQTIVTLTITAGGNTGTTLHVTNVAVGGTNYSGTQSATPLSIAKGTSGTITITLDLRGVDPLVSTNNNIFYQGTLDFDVDTGAGQVTQHVPIDITATGQNEPTAAISLQGDVVAQAVDFGTVKVGKLSAEKSVTIVNSGTYKLVLGTAAKGGANGSEFTITSDTCSGQTVQPQNSCTIKGKFTPTTPLAEPPVATAKTATITINTNAGKVNASGSKDTPDAQHAGTVTLNGTAADSDIAISTGTIPFNEVFVSASKALTFTINNTNGSFVLTVNSVTAGAPFVVSGVTTPLTVPVGATSAPITVTFTPVAATSYTGTVTIVSDDPDNPTKTISLTGAGVAYPVSASSSSVNFGTVIKPDNTASGFDQGCVDNANGTVTCTITLTSIVDAQVTNLAAAAVDATHFAAAAPSTATLAAKDATATVAITYTGAAGKTAHTTQVRITGTSGGQSFSRDIAVTGQTNTRPNTPVPTTPTSPTANLTPTLQTSVFADADTDTLKTRTWKIRDTGAAMDVYQTTGTADTLVVPTGILKYAATNYTFAVQDTDSRNLASAWSADTAFSTPATPAGFDQYGVSLLASALKDKNGAPITPASASIADLVTAAGTDPAVPQTAALTAVNTAAGVIKDASGATLTTVDTTAATVTKTNGGTGTQAVVFLAPVGAVITSMKPLTAAGYTVNAAGVLGATPDVPGGINTSGVTLPIGLFDFSVTLPAGTSTKIVIIPPTPFASNTQWYKVQNGGLVAYPNFVVDAKGNGVLTLTDGGAGDQDGVANGIIHDPGGPGTPTASSDNGGNTSGICFIATAAFGSPLDPYVTVLRNFRDTFLLTSRLGRSFVEWYYRTSPPIADYIKDSATLKAGVRLFLFPAIAFSAVSLKLGLIWSLFFAALFITAVLVLGMRFYRHATRR